MQLDTADPNGSISTSEFELDGLQSNQQFADTIANAHRIEHMHTQETTLDNIFIEVTGRELTQ